MSVTGGKTYRLLFALTLLLVGLHELYILLIKKSQFANSVPEKKNIFFYTRLSKQKPKVRLGFHPDSRPRQWATPHQQRKTSERYV